MGSAELRSVVRTARWFAVALVAGMLLTSGGRPVALPFGALVALVAFGRAMGTVHDATVRRQCVGIMAIWTIAAGAAIWDIGTSGRSAVPAAIAWLALGILPVAGLWSLALLVERTNPPAGVRRWTTIGQTSAIAVFGIAAARVGAHLATDQSETEGTTLALYEPFVFLPAVLGLVLGYGSAIGQLMRAADHPLAPREFPSASASRQ